MTDLQHHYKDREPKETIQIVENFFNNRGLILNEVTFVHSKADTYHCMYELLYRNKRLMTSNGKGMTEDYCKASCFAEMYERFCLYAFSFVNNPLIVNDINNYRYAKYGYHLAPKEKELTANDLMNTCWSAAVLQEILPYYSEEYVNQFIDLFFNGHCYGIPFHSFENENDIQYISPTMVLEYAATTGMAAGNTLKEALVQGTSELYERMTIQYFYQTPPEKLFYLKITNLDPSLQQKIKAMEENDNVKVQIFDLSYNYNLPTCMILAQDKKNHLFHIDFGAAPVIEIAIERCITELYQGVPQLPGDARVLTRQKDKPWPDICSDQFNSSHNHSSIIIPEPCILNSEEVDYFNSDIFISSNQITNEAIFKQVNKINQINNLHLRYGNLSLTPNMYAVYVTSDTIILDACLHRFDKYAQYPVEYKDKIFQSIYRIVDYFKILINTPDVPIDTVQNCLITFVQDILPILNKDMPIDEAFTNLQDFINVNFYIIYTCRLHNDPGDYILFFKFLTQQFDTIAITNDTGLRHLFQAYQLVGGYLQDGYSIQDIKKILNYLDINIPIDDLKVENITTLFLIKKLFFDELYNLYNSDDYINFLPLFDIEKAS